MSKIKKPDVIETDRGPAWDFKQDADAALADRSRPAEADQDQDDDDDEAAFEAELDRIIDEDERLAEARFAPQPPPVPETWRLTDPRGAGELARLTSRGDNAELSLAFSKQGGISPGSRVRGTLLLRERALADARNLAPVRRWAAALKELARLDMAAKVAKADAAAAAARREALLLRGEGENLAGRLSDLEDARKAAEKDAAEALRLAAHAAELVTARKREAEAAVKEAHSASTAAASREANARVAEAAERLRARVAEELDALTEALAVRDQMRNSLGFDQDVPIRQLISTLEGEAKAAALAPAQPTA